MTRWITASSLLFTLSCFAYAKDKQSVPMPSQFEIGRHSFFDFGPPFHYYEIIVVKPAESATSVQRITLTPASDACTSATIESASGSLNESVPELLRGMNPCLISDKELRHERKRCKHCLVFSGAQVSMRVKCGSTTRVVRSDILDRDMFDSRTQTPKNTSWTMSVLEHLDQTARPTVMQKPIFPSASEKHSETVTDPDMLREISEGGYDDLFRDAPDKPSTLYRAALMVPKVPSIELLPTSSIRPEPLVLPKYPAIARTAHVEGTVVFTVRLDENANPSNITFKSGPPLLFNSVKDAVNAWRFPATAAGQEMEGSIAFRLNCGTTIDNSSHSEQ